MPEMSTQKKPLSVDSTGNIATSQLSSGTAVQPGTAEAPTSGSRTSTVSGVQPTSTALVDQGFTGFKIDPAEPNMSVGRTIAPPISTAPTVVFDRTAGATKQNDIRTQAAQTVMPSPSPAMVTIQDQSGNKLVVSQTDWDTTYSKQNGRYSISQASNTTNLDANNKPVASASSSSAMTPPMPGLAYNPATKQWSDPITGAVWNGKNLVDPGSSSSASISQDPRDQPMVSDDGGKTWRPKTAAEVTSKSPSASESVLNEFTKAIQALNSGSSVQEQEQAQAAGRAAGAAYDPLIKKAQEEKKQGMAKGLIRAGEAGGFLNSQLSGVASFAETEGGTWIGAGGVLSRMQDEYSGSIASLEAAKMQAVQQAEAAQRKAIRTGKQEDLDNLGKLFTMAQQVEDQKAQKARDTLNEIKTLNDIAKQEKDDAFSTASNLSKMGYKPEEIPKSYLEDLDKGLGAPGAYTRLYNVEQKTKQTTTVKDQLSNAKDLVGLLNDIPAGKTIEVGGVQYMGMNKGSVKTGTETDAQGRVSFWEYNPDTQKTSTTNLGYIGKPSEGWTNVQTDQGWFSYNTKTGVSVPLQPSINTQTIQALVPEGSRTNPFKQGAKDAGVQCGEWMNYVNDPTIGRVWTDTLGEKLAVANKKDWNVPLDQAQVGDTVVQGGSSTGHLFRILDEKTDPANGRRMWQAFEANMVPPGGGAITSTRWVYADDPKNKAAARIPNRSEFQTGTDSRSSEMFANGNLPSLQEINSSRREAVQGLVSQGIRDPNQIKQFLNEAATASGFESDDFTTEEIQGYLKIPTTKSVLGAPTINGRPLSEIFGGSDDNEVLTVAEAKTLNVPYGTTKGQAKKQGITPSTSGGDVDVQSLNKEITTSDTYKAINKGQDSLQFLKSFEDLFNDTGATSAVFSPRENANLKAKYNATILNLKEFFNLGVLNGPDEAILRAVLPDPTNRSAALTGLSLGIYKPSTSTRAGLDNMKSMINQSLDSRFNTMMTVYGNYNPNQVTAIRDLQNRYVDQKKVIDPNISALVKENPSLTNEEIIQIINL